MFAPSKKLAVGLLLLTTAVLCLAAPEGQVVTATLDNGFTVLAVHDTSTDVAGVALAFRAAATEEPPGKTGVRAVLQELVQQKLNELLKSKAGASLDALADAGVQVGANTDRSYVELTGQVVTDEVATTIRLFAQAALKPTFDEGSVAAARENVRAEAAEKEKDPLRGTFNLFRAALGLDNRGLWVLTTEAAVKAITADDLKQFHATHYVGRRGALAVSSALPVAEVKGLAAKTLQDFPSGEAPTITLEPLKLLERTRTKVRGLRPEGSRPLARAAIMVGVPAPGPGQPDFYATEIVREVLAGGEGGRLAESREFRRSLTEPSGDVPWREFWEPVNRAFSPDFSPVAVVAAPRPLKVDAVSAALQREFRRLSEKPPTKEEIAAAKCRLINAYALSRQRKRAQTAILARYHVLGLPVSLDRAYPAKVRAVTEDEVKRVIRKYFQHCAIGVQMPLSG